MGDTVGQAHETLAKAFEVKIAALTRERDQALAVIRWLYEMPQDTDALLDWMEREPAGAKAVFRAAGCEPVNELSDESRSILALTRERDDWKAECTRLRGLCKTFDDDGSDPMPLDQIVAALKDHRFVHADWASWFESHPDDERAQGPVGGAEFHREAEARYSRIISGIARLRSRVEELAGLLRQALPHVDTEDDKTLATIIRRALSGAREGGGPT